MSRLFNRGAATVGCCALALWSTGCGSSSSSPSTSRATSVAAATGTKSGKAPLAGKTVADIANVPNAFITCLRNSYIGDLDAAGAKTFTVYGQFSPTSTQQAVSSAVTRAPSLAIYLSEFPALDEVSLKTLARAKIPTALVLYGKPANTAPNAVLTYNFKAQATALASKLSALSPNIKSVGMIDGVQGNATSDSTDSTVQTALKAKGVSVVSVGHSQYTAQGGATAAQDMLQSHPDLQAIIIQGDEEALAAQRVLARAGSTIPIIVMYSTTKSVVEAVRSGKILFAQEEPISQYGAQIVKALAQIAGGKTVAPQTLGFVTIDKASAASYHAAC